MLSAAEYHALDSAMQFLASPLPWFQDTPQIPAGFDAEVLAVCGNWYDVSHKASALARVAHRRSSATLLLTGGRDERLTPPEAVELGGEPLALREALKLKGVDFKRMVLYTGSRITNHNLRAILLYASSCYAFEQRSIRLQLFEEAFLVRREAAALHVLLRSDPAAARALSSVNFRPVGARTFSALVATHGGLESIALALVHGEVTRLHRYASPAGNATGGRSEALILPAEAGRLHPLLDEQLRTIWARHRDGLLADGQRLLADRALLFRSGAAPRETATRNAT
jgi:hypothetical protein